MKINKSIEDLGILLQVSRQKIENEVKKERGGDLSISSGTLGATLSENMLDGLTGKSLFRAAMELIELLKEPLGQYMSFNATSFFK